VPDARKRATVEFLNWFQTRDAQMFYARAGGIPISSAIYNSPLAAEPRFRWMKAMAEALPHAVNIYYFPQASEVTGILDVGLNRAVAGEITAVAALNSMADQIYHVMASNGKLPSVL